MLPGDSDTPGEQNFPTEGDNLPLLPPPIPWDIIPDPLPPDFPLVRDLAVLPIYTAGSNATVRVKNLGHFSANVGRRLVVQKLAPGSLPEDKGPIGPLFHYSIKYFYLVGMAPGNYVAFITPGDEIPYQANDKKSFTITSSLYADPAVLPVTQFGGKVWIKIKNVGTAPLAPGRSLKIMKLPGGMPVDQGPVGMLAVNAIKPYPGVTLPAGTYKAFVAPSDGVPFDANDAKIFVVSAATFIDYDVLPVSVSAGKATVKIKNIGTKDAPAGPHLKIMKLPGGMPIDHGPIGPLNMGALKTFPGIPLMPGHYKAFVSPGDAPPHHANDSETFIIPTNPDLEANAPFKIGMQVKAVIHCHGPGDYAGGTRVWHLEKFSGGMWVAIPTVGSHIIPAINNAGSYTVQGAFTGNGNYRLRITPGTGDANPANDIKTKLLP